MASESTSLLKPSAEAPGAAPAAAPDAVKRLPYRPDIDGLRAVAVTAVVIFHIDPSWLPGGFLGVDVFYVVSGYVVSGSLMNAPQPDVCEYFSAFYARRLKRLTPALCLFVLITATMLPMVMGPNTKTEYMEEDYISAQLATFGGANFLFALQKATYWDTTLKHKESNPFLHCWSLGVEEQCVSPLPNRDVLFPHLLKSHLSHGRATYAQVLPRLPRYSSRAQLQDCHQADGE